MPRILYPIHTEPVSTQPERVDESKWHQPWTEPVRFRAISAALIAASGAFISPWALTQPEQVTESRWHQPFSEPVRTRWFSPAQQQFTAYGRAAPFPEAVNVAEWLRPFDIPFRRKTAPDGTFAFVPVVASGEVIYPDKWLVQFTDPVRTKKAALQLSEAYTPPTVAAISPSYGWYGALATPTLPRSRHAALAPEGFYFRFIDNPTTPSIASWSEGWTEPVRFRVLSTAGQPDTVGPIIPQPNPPGPTGQYTVSGLYVIDQFTDNTVVYDYGGGVSHRTN